MRKISELIITTDKTIIVKLKEEFNVLLKEFYSLKPEDKDGHKRLGERLNNIMKDLTHEGSPPSDKEVIEGFII